MLLTLAAPYRLALTVGLILMLCESAALLVMPWLGGRLAETFLQETAGSSTIDIQVLFLGALALFAVQAVLKFSNIYLLGGTTTRILADLKIRVYDHLQALPLAFSHRRRHGDTLALLTHDVYVVSDYISGTALAALPLFFTVSGALALMFRIDSLLAMFMPLQS